MSPHKKNIYINALGMINALGESKEEILLNLQNGAQHNLLEDTSSVFDRSVYVAKVADVLEPVDQRFGSYLDSRNNRILQAALQQIEGELKLLKQEIGKDRIAVVTGSSTSGIKETEDALLQRKKLGHFPSKYHYRQQEMGAPADFVSKYFGLTNLSINVSTACSSSAKVFSTARDLIYSGFCDAAIVGGADSLCRMTLNGFSSLESVSQSICNPFSANRDGITIGEAAAVFILSTKPGAVAIRGIGESSDAYHMSAPSPSGEGAERAIRAALSDADLNPTDIAYINLHGTATVKNDEVEAIVVNRVFGPNCWCSSTKPMTGHTLGAAGATEIGICALLLTSHEDTVYLPRNLWDGVIDERLPTIKLVSEHTKLKKKPHMYMMSNSFAFGGSNISVILESSQF